MCTWVKIAAASSNQSNKSKQNTRIGSTIDVFRVNPARNRTSDRHPCPWIPVLRPPASRSRSAKAPGPPKNWNIWHYLGLRTIVLDFKIYAITFYQAILIVWTWTSIVAKEVHVRGSAFGRRSPPVSVLRASAYKKAAAQTCLISGDIWPKETLDTK